MSKPAQWRNRIVGQGEESPDQLLANPANWRIHPKAQQEALAGVLDEVGWVQQVLVNQQTGHVVDGHLRVALAISRQEPTVPVLYVDLDPAEEALVLATLDPLSALAATDKEQLDALLREVSTGDAAVQSMLGKLAADSGITEFDHAAEWQGMPEFKSEDKSAFRSLAVHFKDQDAVNKFAALVGQQITDKTRYLWFPEIEIERYADKRYSDES